MPEEPQEVPLSDADVDAFAETLDRWAESLPLEERGLLLLLLARAEAGGAAGRTGLEEGEFTTSRSPGRTAAETLAPALGDEAVAFMQQPPNARGCNWSSWGRGIVPN